MSHEKMIWRIAVFICLIMLGCFNSGTEEIPGITTDGDSDAADEDSGPAVDGDTEPDDQPDGDSDPDTDPDYDCEWAACEVDDGCCYAGRERGESFCLFDGNGQPAYCEVNQATCFEGLTSCANTCGDTPGEATCVSSGCVCLPGGDPDVDGDSDADPDGDSDPDADSEPDPDSECEWGNCDEDNGCCGIGRVRGEDFCIEDGLGLPALCQVFPDTCKEEIFSCATICELIPGDPACQDAACVCQHGGDPE